MKKGSVAVKSTTAFYYFTTMKQLRLCFKVYFIVFTNGFRQLSLVNSTGHSVKYISYNQA